MKKINGILGVSLLILVGCSTKVPIIAVQLSDDDGRNRATISKQEVSDWVRYANSSWSGTGYEFTFDEERDFITVKSTLLNSIPADNDNRAWEYYNIIGNYLVSLQPATHVPVFFRSHGQTAWSWGPGQTNYISMPSWVNSCRKADSGENGRCESKCCPDGDLLAHSLGHYFGLAHTSSGIACEAVRLENADGDTAGLTAANWDDVADTPADPGVHCIQEQSRCGGAVQVNGIEFRPPVRNLMSMYRCAKPKLSDGQKAVIESARNNPWRIRLGAE
ncbi:MAG: hypothetical protein OEZ16_00605 [Chromatiales bacterium]|nr:hypothetical protein [Chromatiales bacterium]